ncbi:normocyte-binding protein [Brevibacillus sp. SYSU BS000544]|uniref:normocyte-binding protein n=1 Tax=Brevibacillus sp. SYSU BS000544 TaxID=3416443 RepID=UPI003CE53AB3
MRDIILDRLSKMDDLEQRKLLKQMMTGVFLHLIDYQQEMNQKLEDRVFSEITGEENRHDIYVTICSRENVDPIHEFLYPMIPEDIKMKKWDSRKLLTQLSQREEAKLMTIFLECEHAKLMPLFTSQRTFSAEMVTATGKKQLEVRLQQNRSYLEEIERLYHVFLLNSIPWKTLNHPYAMKFFDVILVRSESQLDEEDEIVEINIHLEEFEPFKKTDIIPLWNIERLALKNIGFPIPAMDRVNFEHVLSLRSTGTQHGYLIDGEEDLIRYIKRTPEEVTIVSPREKADVWNVLKITKPAQTSIGRFDYELLSNKRKESFISAYARKQAMVVRAKGEITRMIHSFDASRYLDLEHVEILDSATQSPLTYEMNPFISDNIRIQHDKKIMKLAFRPLVKNGFLLQDIMSFLVSEVQLYFPEYKCEGEWA